MKPLIEYHLNIRYPNFWITECESHPVGTTLDEVIAKGWTGAEGVELMHLHWSSYAWPGGYEIHYITGDGGVLCHKCANDNLDLTLGDDPQWQIVALDVNYEHQNLHCDNCGSQVKPAYGPDDEDEDDQEQATTGPT